jgi:metallo-beta-lactamase class B
MTLQGMARSIRLRIFLGLLAIVISGLIADAQQSSGSALVADRNGPLHGQYYVKPFKMIGNIYFVGFSNNAAYLITTPQGHFLIDAIYEDINFQEQKNIEDLGFKIKDVKYLLNAHAHSDHVNGLADMKTRTGATVVAMAEDVQPLEDGGVSDFRNDGRKLWEPVKVDKVIHDGDALSLGGVTLTARKTAGHTKGCTTWTMMVDDGGKKRQAIFICSLGLNGGVPLVNYPKYPNIAEDYMRSFDVLRSIPAEVFLVSHVAHYNFDDKVKKMGQGGPNPFIDPQGYKDYIVRFEKDFKEQYEKDKAAAANR